MSLERDAAEKLFGLLGDDLDFRIPDEEGGTDESEARDEADDTEQDEIAAEGDDSDGEEYDDEEYEGEDEEEDDDGPDQQQTFKVKVAGKEQVITLDEALAGYQRQQDYTRKTQEVAEERRNLDGERTSLRAEREQYLQKLQVLGQALESTIQAEPDWDKLRAENPTKYAAEYADWQRKMDQMRVLRTEAEKVQRQQWADQQKQRDQRLQEAGNRLLEAVPEWQKADPAKVQAEKIKLAEYAMATYGFTPQDLEAVEDHRPIVLLRKAMLFDEMVQKGQEVVKKAKPRKVLAPGTPKGPSSVRKRTQRARERLSSSGRPADAAAVLFDLIDDF
jgi:hypothetical protein